MRALEDMRPGEGRRPLARVGGAILALAVAAGCAGENIFPTFVVDRQGSLLGPQVDITAPLPPVTIAPGDSVNVTARLSSADGITEVVWSGALVAGGPAPFTPVTVPLVAVTDTTMSRFLRRTGATGGAALIIVTARDIFGQTGADTISVTLGS
jgi:hypothetical protein